MYAKAVFSLDGGEITSNYGLLRTNKNQMKMKKVKVNQSGVGKKENQHNNYKNRT